MGKLRSTAIGLAGGALVALGLSTPLAATPLGPDAAACRAGAREPALLVRIVGFKARTGAVRVQAYGGNPARYFDKGSYLKRVDVAVPPTGLVEVCVPLSRPGTYAVSVRHDLDGTGKTGMSDGGGMSGNPVLSLFDVMFRRKPMPASVQVRVGGGVVPVPVVLNYIRGASFGPISMAAR